MIVPVVSTLIVISHRDVSRSGRMSWLCAVVWVVVVCRSLEVCAGGMRVEDGWRWGAAETDEVI